ncbi:hypothetical protein N7528_004121 [Penicillium herquei]|nr:hypothetical protein N7528_004121 [Penicillium herquei]
MFRVDLIAQGSGAPWFFTADAWELATLKALAKMVSYPGSGMHCMDLPLAHSLEARVRLVTGLTRRTSGAAMQPMLNAALIVLVS